MDRSGDDKDSPPQNLAPRESLWLHKKCTVRINRYAKSGRPAPCQLGLPPSERIPSVKTVQNPDLQGTEASVWNVPVSCLEIKEERDWLVISEKNYYVSLFSWLLLHCLEHEVSPNSYLSYVSSMRH